MASHICKRSHSSLALLFLDLDRFKAVNDNYGHEVGDQLLVAVAERLKDCIREADTLARQGGDEFVILLNDVDKRRDAGKVAEHLIDALQAPFLVEGKECSIGVSIGIAIYPDDGNTPEELARKADAAMYRAKESGGRATVIMTRQLARRPIAACNWKTVCAMRCREMNCNSTINRLFPCKRVMWLR